jgi:hypothetical protein
MFFHPLAQSAVMGTTATADGCRAGRHRFLRR